MAITQGHGNPKWARDEVLLALDLYFQCGGRVPASNDPRVVALSETLRGLPYHPASARKPSFRNADGVVFKLENLRQVATGKGLANVAAIDRQIWVEYGQRPDELAQVVRAIRNSVLAISAGNPIDEWEFAEGRLLTELHRRWERSPAVRKQLIAKRRRLGRLQCDLCGGHAPTEAEDFEAACFEVHHLVGLAQLGSGRKTRLADVALLHAGCHRLSHAAIASTRKWLSLSEVREVVGV
jgi:5-methylcytosine-specific restriction protein A